MIDIRQSPQWADYQRSLGWTVERKNGVNYAIRQLPLIGSLIKIQRPETIDFEYIEELRKKYRAFQIIIEPNLTTSTGTFHNLLYNHGFKLSKSPFLSTKTLHLNLTKSESQLLKEMHYKTRYNIVHQRRTSLRLERSKEIELFIKLYHQWHRGRLLFLSQAKQIREMYRSFGKNAHIFFAYDNNTSEVAALLTINHRSISYYLFAASSPQGKKLFAPTLLTWEAIKEAKKKGCRIFDFEGIYDERFPIKSWQGFTRFKKSFGGQEVEYPGCYTKFKLFSRCP